MSDPLPFLKSLLSVSGLTSYEYPVRFSIEQAWKPLLDELHTSRLGSLHGLKKGSGQAPRRSLMIAAHMDTIGMMVSKVVEGFIHFEAIGGIDLRVLPGTPVLVHAQTGDLPGVVALPSLRLLPESQHQRFPDIQYLVVDTGLTAPQVLKRVQVGDLISLATQPVELAGEILSGHSVDNRASIAALTLALQMLQGKQHAWDVWATATVQEETTYAGAATSAFELGPDLAVVLDVTFAKGPGTNGWESFIMGKGPTLAMGPNIHPFVFKRFKQLSDEAGLDLPVEPIPAASGTDAEAIQLTADGIPTMLLEIPVRNMHTPVEMVSMRDIERTGHLLADFVLSLEADFLENIQWE